MNLHELLERTKSVDEKQSFSISVQDNSESLVALHEAKQLKINPIWCEPIDAIEGPLYTAYIQDNPAYSHLYARSPIQKKLMQAAESLPENLSLVVRASHRPLDVQIQLLEMVKQQYIAKHPDVSSSVALDYARMFVGDPTLKTPPHCSGAAVDVDVVNTQTGELLDFGCPINTDGEVSFLHSTLVTPEQRANRLILLKSMLSAGFASFKNEWWHYSYGDQIWAEFYMQPYALYGLIEPQLTKLEQGTTDDKSTRNTVDTNTS